MSFKGITGPGEYRTRDGRKATVLSYEKDCWLGVIQNRNTVTGLKHWLTSGRHAFDVRSADIIDYWTQEEPMNKPNAKDIANAIAEFPKDCQDKVTKLVEKLGFEVEKEPEPKAGQVWLCHGEPRLFVADGRRGVFVTSLAGEVTCKGSTFQRLIDINGFTFVADTLEEYYRKKFAGELP